MKPTDHKIYRMLDEFVDGVDTEQGRLHKMLDQLQDKSDADGGRLDSDRFWHFVSALAQGRGLAEHYDSEGLKEKEQLPYDPSIEEDEKDRNGRVAKAVEIPWRGAPGM